MDAVVAIFSQLGVNQSVLIQFVLFVAFFLLMKVVFLNTLQSVIFKREEKTVTLSGESDLKLEEIKRLASVYNQKISEKNKEVKASVDTRKQAIVKKEEQKYKEEETSQSKLLEAQRVEIENEINSKKSQILTEAESLAVALVQKVTKG